MRSIESADKDRLELKTLREQNLEAAAAYWRRECGENVANNRILYTFTGAANAQNRDGSI